jgi:hypothetical protein
MPRRARPRRALALDGVITVSPEPQPRPSDRFDGIKPIRRVEYLVEWARECESEEGFYVKEKRFGSRARAYDRVGLMTSDEPWRYFGSKSDRARNGDDFVCCGGGKTYEPCSCEGKTLAEDSKERREKFGRLLWVRVSKRVVTRTAWEPVDQVTMPEPKHPTPGEPYFCPVCGVAIGSGETHTPDCAAHFPIPDEPHGDNCICITCADYPF